MSWAGWSAINKATVWDQLLSTNMRMFTAPKIFFDPRLIAADWNALCAASFEALSFELLPQWSIALKIALDEAVLSFRPSLSKRLPACGCDRSNG